MICSSCGEVIVDHAYSVQRRKIRPVSETLPDGTKKFSMYDAVDSSHAGIILGPEFDMYCPTCYDSLPTIEELIRDHKKSLDSNSENVD
jgi:hypothetical protein